MSSLSPSQISALEQVLKKPALLPLFLNEISGLKWFDKLQENGLLDPKKNPEPIQLKNNPRLHTTPEWSVLNYLEKTAPELSDNPEYSEKYLSFLHEATDNLLKKEIFNHRTWWIFAKIIALIPIEHIKINEINLFDKWLASENYNDLVAEPVSIIFDKLLASTSSDSNELILRLLEIITAITWLSIDNKTRYFEEEPIIPLGVHGSDNIFNKHSRHLGEKLKERATESLEFRVKEILDKNNDDENSVYWRPSIEDSDQNTLHDNARHLLVTALREVYLGFIYRSASAADESVSDLLQSKYILFNRLGVYLINEYFDQLKTIAPQVITEKYFDTNHIHEMYLLLKNRFTEFEKAQQKEIITLIQSKSEKITDEDPEKQKRRRSNYILKWLSSIKDYDQEDVNKIYSENLKITKYEPEHPEFPFYMTSFRWSGENSTYTVQELLSLDIDDLVTLINEFQEEPGWDNPTVSGLAHTLKDAFEINPEHFSGNLKKFLDVKYEYIYHLIYGYKEKWETSKNDYWEELLEFFNLLITKNGFWEEANDLNSEHSMAAEVVKAIAETLKSGTVSDDSSFNPDLLPLGGQIITAILENINPISVENTKDIVFKAMNNPRGKAIEALINFALRKCRLSEKNNNEHKVIWDTELKILFDKEIARIKDNNVEFLALLPMYISNFYYLDKNWTIENIDLVFDKSNRTNWLCAFHGFAYVNHFYPELYQFLKDNDHLRLIIDDNDAIDELKKKVIQHVVAAYLNGYENIEEEESVLRFLISRWDLNELREIIYSARVFKAEESHQEKIITLWKFIVENTDKDQSKDQRILAKLCDWTIYLNKLNKDEKSLLLAVAPFADFDYNSYTLIKELKRLVEIDPNFIADVYLVMLENFTPMNKKEDIEYTINKIFNADDTTARKADQICDTYIERVIKLDVCLNK